MSIVQHGRVDLTPLVTHHYTLDQLPEAFDLFSHQGDGVMKVAIYPTGLEARGRVRHEPAEIEC
jgi:threonine dehydrogenase-like Zn-dependent dehydrogenase